MTRSAVGGRQSAVGRSVAVVESRVAMKPVEPADLRTRKPEAGSWKLEAFSSYNDGFPPVPMGRSRSMLFDLRQLHGERAHVERTFEAAAFEPPDEDYRVAAPVHLSMDVEKASADVFRVTGRVSDAARAGVRAVSRAVRDCRSMRLSSCATCRRARTAARATARLREDDLTTAFYREGVARRHRPAARAVSAGAADEAAVQRGVPGAVCRSAAPI